MKRNYFILFFLLSSITFAQQPTPPLQTLMEVEYFGSHYGLGSGMLGLGDINSDGKPDFAVSAGNIGKTFIYFGGKGVLDSTVDLVIKGGGIMAKGDLNGDGKMDLVVLVPADSTTGYLNQLAIYFGRKDSTIKIDTVPNIIILDPAGGGETRFGETFAIGDLNNDGYDDLVVGAPFYGADQGKVYVYLGKTNFNGIADSTVEGDTVLSFYGYNIKIADINGDGIKDLAIGSDRRKYNNVDSIEVDDGFLDIYCGKDGWKFTKNGYDQRFDRSNSAGVLYPQIFGLVDVNADGKADLSMLPPDDSVYFFYGRSDSVMHTPDFILTNPDTSFYSGFWSAPSDIGDINNDGKPDYAILLTSGPPSACISVYLGNPVPQVHPIGDRCKYGSHPFDIIVNVGDVNGDGVNDFGSVSSRTQFSEDGYFIIFRGDTNYVTGIEKNSPSVPHDIILKQNYPNPFNPSTTIEYNIPIRAAVKLYIYDFLGKEIIKLTDDEQEAGTYIVKWNGKNSNGIRVASGTYFYRLIINGVLQETKKLLLIR